MTIDGSILAVVAAAGFLLGFAKAGTAGALAPFVTVLMALVLPADQAIGLLLPMLIIGDMFSIGAVWNQWDSSLIRPLVIAAILGIGLGTLVLLLVDEATLSRLIGLIVLVFVAWYAWSRRPRVAPKSIQRFGWLSGLAAGLMSTIAHMGGPPLIIYLMSANLAPVTLVGTSVIFFALMNVLKIPTYIAAGVLDAELVAQTIWAWTLIPVGVWTGRRLINRIPKDSFERLLIVLLALGALVLFFG